jgi:hypothetical protein
VIGDAGQHVGEIVLWVAPVELGGLDQGVDRGGRAAAGVGAGEQVILAADRDDPGGSSKKVVGQRVTLENPIRGLTAIATFLYQAANGTLTNAQSTCRK